jgi:mitochondrial import receptor subunit TOM22
MVEFEEIKDEHYQNDDDGFVTEDSGEFSDTASEASQDEDIDIANETIFDRIIALKDMIPAERRHQISRFFSKSYQYGTMATFIGGKAAYILITSVLMIGIPYALSLDEDRMLAEQERQMQLQQGMSEVKTYYLYILRIGASSYGAVNSCRS